jgi:F-type H+-transporting ATPase subunit epsilon
MATAPELNCSVITPEAKVFEGRVESVVIPVHDGEVGILPDRAPLVARLGAGVMRVRVDGSHDRRSWFIDGGFAQVLENRVVVLTQKAVSPERIDASKAAEQLAAARAMPARDELAFKRKAAAEGSARAQLRAAGQG